MKAEKLACVPLPKVSMVPLLSTIPETAWLPALNEISPLLVRVPAAICKVSLFAELLKDISPLLVKPDATMSVDPSSEKKPDSITRDEVCWFVTAPLNRVVVPLPKTLTVPMMLNAVFRVALFRFICAPDGATNETLPLMVTFVNVERPAGENPLTRFNVLPVHVTPLLTVPPTYMKFVSMFISPP